MRITETTHHVNRTFTIELTCEELRYFQGAISDIPPSEEIEAGFEPDRCQDLYEQIADEIGYVL
jgi:hypothetical protein